MKKLAKRLLVIAVVVLLLLSVSGCGNQQDWKSMRELALKMEDIVDDAKVRENTERMLSYILADDFENAYTMVCTVATREEFRQPYADIRAVLQGVTDYELVASYRNNNVTNGVSYVGIRYMLTSGEQKILVEATRQEDGIGLVGFHVYTYDPVTQTGTLTAMQGANAVQWIFLVIGLLEGGFMIWMFVDCCRSKIRRKWLWLILTLLGAVAISVTVANGINLRYNIGLFFNLHTALIRYSSGGFTVRLMFPLGAVPYIILKKKLIKPQEVPAIGEVPAEELPQTEE